MKYTLSDRGFKQYEPVGNMRVYESSSAEEPKIWLHNELGGDSAHLTTAQALELATVLISAVNNHYQLQEGR